jgi:ferrous iron transport protein B
MAARRGAGIDDLLRSVEEVTTGIYVTNPRHVTHRDQGLEEAVQTLVSQIEGTFPGLDNSRWVALRLLEGDESIVDAVRDGMLGELKQTKAPIPNRLIPLEARS